MRQKFSRAVRQELFNTDFLPRWLKVFFEGGETHRELLNRGANEEEATKESLITMGKNIPLLLATNTLEGLAFFSSLKVSNKALKIAGCGAANSSQEQYEEFAQEGIQNAARGEPYSWLPWDGAPNQYEAAERVRYLAALLGGLGGTTQAISGTDENQENWKRGDQTSNLTAKQAEVWNAARYASTRAKEKFGKAIDDKELDAVNFFNSMFYDASKFQDTPENRQAIATHYGDELNAFVQKNSQTPPQQKTI